MRGRTWRGRTWRGRAWPRLLGATGLLLLVGGFAYDVAFAGIPFPDPTPEMAAEYARHARVAAAIRWAGLLVVLAGAAGGFVRRLARRRA